MPGRPTDYTRVRAAGPSVLTPPATREGTGREQTRVTQAETPRKDTKETALSSEGGISSLSQSPGPCRHEEGEGESGEPDHQEDAFKCENKRVR